MFARYEKFRLNQEQLKQLADFASNLSLVFLAGVVAPIFSNSRAIELLTILVGVSFGILCLISSLYILKGRIV